MGIGGRAYEACKLEPYCHTRGSTRCFSKKRIFDMKFNKYKKPF